MQIAVCTVLAGASTSGSGSASAKAARAGHQSALLSLAAMHARFGNAPEVLQSLSETFKVARQHNDPWCQVRKPPACAA